MYNTTQYNIHLFKVLKTPNRFSRLYCNVHTHNAFILTIHLHTCVMTSSRKCDWQTFLFYTCTALQFFFWSYHDSGTREDRKCILWNPTTIGIILAIALNRAQSYIHYANIFKFSHILYFSSKPVVYIHNILIRALVEVWALLSTLKSDLIEILWWWSFTANFINIHSKRFELSSLQRDRLTRRQTDTLKQANHNLL